MATVNIVNRTVSFESELVPINGRVSLKHHRDESALVTVVHSEWLKRCHDKTGIDCSRRVVSMQLFRVIERYTEPPYLSHLYTTLCTYIYRERFIILPCNQVTVGVGAPPTLHTSRRLVPMTTVSLWGLSMKYGAIPGAKMINKQTNRSVQLVVTSQLTRALQLYSSMDILVISNHFCFRSCRVGCWTLLMHSMMFQILNILLSFQYCTEYWILKIVLSTENEYSTKWQNDNCLLNMCI